MTHWKLILAYDGTPYHGWQIQPGLRTVQGLLSDAIHRTLGERILPQGSGRTDAGVHALGQVASFSLEAPIPAHRLQTALNRCLPPAIRVLSAELVPPDFHARHSALGKTYEYRIFPLKPTANPATPEPGAGAPQLASEMWAHNPICPPTLAPFVWPCPWPVSLDLLNRAAAHVLGTHDFTSFTASDPDLTARALTEPGGMWAADGAALCTAPEILARTPVRTISHSAWHLHEGLFIYRVTATGFLHHMVRNLVGTFVQCGANRLSPDAIPAILDARSRSAAGPTAPASGLFLLNVEYPSTSSSI